MRHLRIILPFRLPTWNQLLAMNHWQRKEVRDWIKGAVSIFIREHKNLPTKTDAVVRLRLTDSSLQAYCRMITPASLRKSRIRRKLRRMEEKRRS
jgi:hypothetical protein